MADIVDRETRSRMMSRIKSRDTGPEMQLRRALWKLGVRGYRCHYAKAPGRPDVAFVGRRLAVFVDGGFWHGHPEYFTFGKSGDAWDKKIRRNMARDREVNSALFEAGWSVIRLWDFEVKSDPEGAAETVRRHFDALAPPVPDGGSDPLAKEWPTRRKPHAGRLGPVAGAEDPSL